MNQNTTTLILTPKERKPLNPKTVNDDIQGTCRGRNKYKNAHIGDNSLILFYRNDGSKSSINKRSGRDEV